MLWRVNAHSTLIDMWNAYIFISSLVAKKNVLPRLRTAIPESSASCVWSLINNANESMKDSLTRLFIEFLILFLGKDKIPSIDPFATLKGADSHFRTRKDVLHEIPFGITKFSFETKLLLIKIQSTSRVTQVCKLWVKKSLNKFTSFSSKLEFNNDLACSPAPPLSFWWLLFSFLMMEISRAILLNGLAGTWAEIRINEKRKSEKVLRKSFAFDFYTQRIF